MSYAACPLLAPPPHTHTQAAAAGGAQADGLVAATAVAICQGAATAAAYSEAYAVAVNKTPAVCTILMEAYTRATMQCGAKYVDGPFIAEDECASRNRRIFVPVWITNGWSGGTAYQGGSTGETTGSSAANRTGAADTGGGGTSQGSTRTSSAAVSRAVAPIGNKTLPCGHPEALVSVNIADRAANVSYRCPGNATNTNTARSSTNTTSNGTNTTSNGTLVFIPNVVTTPAINRTGTEPKEVVHNGTNIIDKVVVGGTGIANAKVGRLASFASLALHVPGHGQVGMVWSGLRLASVALALMLPLHAIPLCAITIATMSYYQLAQAGIAAPCFM